MKHFLTVKRSACVQMVVSVLTGLAVLSLGGCPTSPNGNGNNGDGTLGGTWVGEVTYTVALVTGRTPGNEYSFTRSATVVFTAEGQPDTLDLVLGNGEEFFLLPADELLKEGNTAQFSFDRANENTGEVTTTTVDATVTSISRSSTAFSIGLDLAVEFSGANIGTMGGTYTLDARVQNDGTLAWNGLTDLRLGDGQLDIGIRVTTAGTLTKQ